MIYINDEPVIRLDPEDPSISKDIEEGSSSVTDEEPAVETPLC